MATETLSDEQAVRGAHPDMSVFETKVYWPGQGARMRWIVIKRSIDSLSIAMGDTREEALSNARQHPTVVAWEAEQGRSTKVERPIARRVFTGPMNVYLQSEADAYMDALEAERDQLLAENARLRERVQSLEAKS